MLWQYWAYREFRGSGAWWGNLSWTGRCEKNLAQLGNGARSSLPNYWSHPADWPVWSWSEGTCHEHWSEAVEKRRSGSCHHWGLPRHCPRDTGYGHLRTSSLFDERGPLRGWWPEVEVTRLGSHQAARAHAEAWMCTCSIRYGRLAVWQAWATAYRRRQRASHC
jgi:hypothetical protein